MLNKKKRKANKYEMKEEETELYKVVNLGVQFTT